MKEFCWSYIGIVGEWKKIIVNNPTMNLYTEKLGYSFSPSN